MTAPAHIKPRPLVTGFIFGGHVVADVIPPNQHIEESFQIARPSIAAHDCGAA